MTQLPRRLLRSFLWSMLAGLALYVVVVLASDLSAVSAVVHRLGISGWLVILGLSLTNYALRFLRWQGYLVCFGYRVPAGASLAYYLGGFAFTMTPGKAGEAVRSLYLKRHAVAYVHSLAAFFAERLVDVLAIVLLSFAAVLTYPQGRWPVAILATALVLLLPFIHSGAVHRFLERQRERFPPGRLKSGCGHFLGLLQSAALLLRTRTLYTGLLLGLLAWGAEGLAFHVILLSLDVPVSLLLAMGIYAISILVGALSFIPGGLGSTEAVMGMLLMLAGADAATAVASTLICRVATLWFAVVIGLGFIAGLQLRSKPADNQPATARPKS